MTRLDDFAGNDDWTQFGEAGCISHLLERIGVKHKMCVEFGAGDGESCSNTARLWRVDGWRAVLVEPDPVRFDALEGNARLFDTIRERTLITPTGPGSISALLARHEITDIDFMSIDVDGDDYFILEQLAVRPRVIAIEFNPTVPPHLELSQSEPGGAFGASVLAIIRLAERVGYRFVGATYCNAFLVVAEEAAPFDNYETDPETLFSRAQYTYAVTDFAGRIVLAGQVLPWGTREPYVLPLEGATYITQASDNPQHLRRGFESEWGPALWLPVDGLVDTALQHLLATSAPDLVCIDLTNQSSLDAVAWIWETAAATSYRPLLAGRVLGLIRSAP